MSNSVLWPLPPVGYRVEHYENIGSTNVVALERAREGDHGRLWIVADEQLSGRGRRGRLFVSPKGNLYSTLLLVEDVLQNAEHIATLSFVAGISMAEALLFLNSKFNCKIPIQLKWPNDFLLDGIKAGGILLEMAQLEHDKKALVIGIGLNVISKPENIDYPTACLHQYETSIYPLHVFEALSHAWARNYALWSQENGVAHIRQKWLDHAAGLGKPISVINHDQTIQGIFETIDDSFHCMIRRDDKTMAAVTVGDVFFGDAATKRLG